MFSTLSHKRHHLGGGGSFSNIKCLLIFCTTFLRNISHSKTNSSRHCHKPVDLHINCLLLFLSDFTATWIFSTGFRKILRYQMWKSLQWERNFSMRPDKHNKAVGFFAIREAHVDDCASLTDAQLKRCLRRNVAVRRMEVTTVICVNQMRLR